jgi:UDP-2,3-diacylglucosamine pyrophosphatase LpxH
MSSKANEPGGLAYNDKAAMAYCLIEILGIHPDALDNGSNEILRALTQSGISKFYAEFAVLGTDDIMNLPVESYAGYTAVPGNAALPVLAHGDKKIGLLHGRQLCALLAYYHHTCVVDKRLVDVMELTKEGFDIFRMSLYSPQNPIMPYRKILIKSTNNDMSAWQKSVKMDAKAYKEYRDEAYWNQYKKHFINPHALGHLINKKHAIMNE